MVDTAEGAIFAYVSGVIGSAVAAGILLSFLW